MENQPPASSSTHGNYISVDLTVSTWEKDSHGLYDYEMPTNRTQLRKFKIEGPCKIFRNWLSKV